MVTGIVAPIFQHNFFLELCSLNPQKMKYFGTDGRNISLKTIKGTVYVFAAQAFYAYFAISMTLFSENAKFSNIIKNWLVCAFGTKTKIFSRFFSILDLVAFFSKRVNQILISLFASWKSERDLFFTVYL